MSSNAKNYVLKLFTPALSYADVVKVYQHLSESVKQEIAKKDLCFVDWVVSEAVIHLTAKEADEFRNILYSTFKQKLEIGILTSVGGVELQKIKSSILGTTELVSNEFLTSMLAGDKIFEIIEKNDVKLATIRDNVSSSTDTSIRKVKCIEELISPSFKSINRLFNKSDHQSTPGNDVTSNGDSSLKCVSDTSISSGVSSSSLNDHKLKQLKFLYACAPDVIVALQPGATLQKLFNAYHFWKTLNNSSPTTFITWLVDMAYYRYTNNNLSTTFNDFKASLKRTIAQEAYYYVTNKSRTTRELVTLVSKAQPNFVDDVFVLDAVKSNTHILKIVSMPDLPFASSQFVSKATNSASNVRSSNDASPKQTNNIQISTLPAKETNCNFGGMLIPIDINAKIVPLLTIKVEWTAIVCSLNGICSIAGTFSYLMKKNFDCYLNFLIQFSLKFQPLLNYEEYTLHLMNLLLKVVNSRIDCNASKTIQFQVLLNWIEASCDRKGVVDANFLRTSLLTFPYRYRLENDIVTYHSSLTTTPALFDKTNGKTNASVSNSNIKTLEDIKKIPDLEMLLTTQLTFELFLRTYQLLPNDAKSLLKTQAKSFYSIILSMAEIHHSDVFTNHLMRIVVLQMEKYFVENHITRLPILSIQEKLCSGDFSFIHCPDIRDAVECCSEVGKLSVEGAWVYLKQSEPTSTSLTCLNAYPDQNNKGKTEKYTNEQLVKNFVEDVTFILEQTKWKNLRFGKLVKYCQQIPEFLREYISDTYGSLFKFMNVVLDDTQKLHVVLEEAILLHLSNNCRLCEDLRASLFNELPHFIKRNELIEFFHTKENLFVVVSHFQFGDIVATVCQTGEDEELSFLNDIEKRSFLLCKEAFSEHAKQLPLIFLFRNIWHNPDLSDEQRFLMFGAIQSTDRLLLCELHFKCFLMKYPATFTLQEDQVCCSNRIVKQSTSTLDSSISIVISDSESGAIDSDNSGKKISKKRKQNVEKKSKTRNSAKKRRRHKKKRKRSPAQNISDSSQSTNNEDDPAVADTVLSSLPDRLLQDVALARILSSENNKMDLENLVDSLLSTLFHKELKSTICNSDQFRHLFKVKIVNTLSEENQFEFCDLQEDGFYNSVRLHLQPKQSSPVSRPKQLSLVFRWIDRLTGVSNKRLTNYIHKVLDINRKPLSISILFKMVCQKYAAKKATSDTPNDIIHCQVIDCLYKNPSFFVNIIQKTCCLFQYLIANEQNEELSSVIQSLGKDEIHCFILDCLEENKGGEGIEIGEVCAKLASNIHDRTEGLLSGSIKIIVQAIIAESRKIGFTPLGKIARQQDDYPPDTLQTPDDSSDNELKMDISDDECAMLPDSTNDERPHATDRRVSEESVEKMCNNYIEADVIRCDDEKSKCEDVYYADTSGSMESQSPHITSNESYFSPASVSYRAPSHDAATFSVTSTKEIKPLINFYDTPSLISNKSAFCSMDINSSKLLQLQEKQNEFCGSELQKSSYINGNSFDTISESNIPCDAALSSVATCEKSNKNVLEMLKSKKHQERGDKLKEFTINYLSKCGYSCETKQLIDAAYEQYKEERFAKSILAFEAYVRDFIAMSEDLFSFGNRYGDIGVTWTFYRPPRVGTTYRAKVKMPFSEILRHIPNVVVSFLVNQPERKACLDNICEYVRSQFSDKLAILHPDEVMPMCRNLILVSLIRNLQRFMFGKGQPIVYLRQSNSSLPEKTKTETSSHLRSFSSCNTSSTVTKTNSKYENAKNIVAALQLLADILRKNGPCTKTKLREYWAVESNAALRKVLSTGVSFALSLRKFETYFPLSANGLVSVDENAFQRFLQGSDL